MSCMAEIRAISAGSNWGLTGRVALAAGTAMSRTKSAKPGPFVLASQRVGPGEVTVSEQK